ncbi:MAG: SIS domain-containing protein [Desulfobacteraceae bacterium]|nr:SIS domain-containing protein [Desulfobacteraceae bacterium]MBU4002027.1 SIS domain-containing protein [Pseudomonadota bacterium]
MSRAGHLKKTIGKRVGSLWSRVYFGRQLETLPEGSVVFFPIFANRLFCGLAGIISVKKSKAPSEKNHPARIEALVQEIGEHSHEACLEKALPMGECYLMGDEKVDLLLATVRSLKNQETFYPIVTEKQVQEDLQRIHGGMTTMIEKESEMLNRNMGTMDANLVPIMIRRLETLKDAAWSVRTEILDNADRIKHLLGSEIGNPDMSVVSLFRKINAVLNSIDRLEVRGRDSAGISLLFWMTRDHYEEFQTALSAFPEENLLEVFESRTGKEVLLNGVITVHETQNSAGSPLMALSVVYKFASEVGSLGDNIGFIRNQIRKDKILKLLATFPLAYDSVSAHTRWASVGAISESNCHPVDNEKPACALPSSGILHVCLNGDIDNYLDLKQSFEARGVSIHKDITTDTKIIPLVVEQFIQKGEGIAEAFRKAVNLFEGSHAISMHTDLAPGKMFLAQKGSGQTIFVGLADDFYMSTSEVYGFVEETSRFIKMDGEKTVEGKNGLTQGQIFILDQNSPGGVEGIKAFYYDGTPITFSEKDVKTTQITSRDIDRQDFPHYFLKEISEAPDSVEKTLANRWKIADDKTNYYVALDEKTVPLAIKNALSENRIRRIYLVGQGTAGVAAKVCSDILNHYLDDPLLQVTALKASELSGFKIKETDHSRTFADTLVIAITQSGTTTDTNRTVDMVKERGAYTLAIVNRRDSDITFKVDGVIYTSSGRDIEMSVASTKAFYSQIVAGALLGLYISVLKGSRDQAFMTAEIKQLLELPAKMRKVLALRPQIHASASRLATTKNYWAVVGSGPNKAAADEIRIKLSELCYKTISSDYVEDKKHIDLSSEPLIIICAAGARSSVIGDIIKDTAIFQAHKAVPIVIADEGETRFDPYAADVFHVPPVPEHLSPVLITLVGHLWGYSAALAINEGSAFFYGFRENLQKLIESQSGKGLDVYEIILDKGFRETIASFYEDFRKRRAQNRLPVIMGLDAVSDLTLLLKYLAGRLPVADFELDFSKKGTALNMLNLLFERVGETINCLSRPVDAIKHQAKTVTVGTSRISEKVEGLLFEALVEHQYSVSYLTNANVMVLKNLQEIVQAIEGSILYKIGGLNLLGEPTEKTTIRVLKKSGILAKLPSRAESETELRGTKRIIVRQGNVYIGKGRKDGRSIIVIPLISTDPQQPNWIEHMLLLNISFRQDVTTDTKIKALGGKYEHIKSIVQENSLAWENHYLDFVPIEELFGRSAEKLGEFIIAQIS